MTEREYVETIRKAAEEYAFLLDANKSHTAAAGEYRIIDAVDSTLECLIYEH
jgi:hypothetical protein